MIRYGFGSLQMSSAIRALMLMVALLAGASLAIKCPPEDTLAEGGPRRVILDLDGGGDDAWALVMLLSNEAEYNICVQAVTCSHGNARVSDVLVNVLRILYSLDRLDVPVYVGASEPLITPGPNRNTSHYFWGNNGFGDVEFDSPFVVDSLVSLHAVEAMNELFEKVGLQTRSRRASRSGNIGSIAFLVSQQDHIARCGTSDECGAAVQNVSRDEG